MRRLTLHLGGSLHGRRLEVAGEPGRYIHAPKQRQAKHSSSAWGNATTPPPMVEPEPYLRVWIEPLEIAVYVREGYEPTAEDEGLI